MLVQNNAMAQAEWNVLSGLEEDSDFLEGNLVLKRDDRVMAVLEATGGPLGNFYFHRQDNIARVGDTVDRVLQTIS